MAPGLFGALIASNSSGNRAAFMQDTKTGTEEQKEFFKKSTAG